jgi:uncharacterized radical SAM superfamily protein
MERNIAVREGELDMSDYKNRIDRLKSLEVLCYSFCIHLLTEERLALSAAKLALLDLFQDEQLWVLDNKERVKRVRQRSVARALEQLALGKKTGSVSVTG